MILKRYFWFINLILVTILVWALADLLMTSAGRMLRTKSTMEGLSETGKMNTSAAFPPLSSFDIIIRNNMFDPSMRIPENQPIKTTETQTAESALKRLENGELPPPTSLNILLTGTAVLEPSQFSIAVIYDSATRTQKLYRTGDAIYDATIKEISPNRVILSRGQGLETLFLVRDKRKGAPPESPSQTNESASSFVEQKGAGHYVLDRNEVNNMVTNINQFMTQLRVRPHFVQGKPIGYLVTDIKSGSVIDQIGLRNGDIVKSVNGLPISEPEQAFEAYQQLMDESQITLEIQRGTDTEVMTYELK